MYAVKKYILGLLQHNNIFSYFTAISLHQEFRFNDIILMLPWHVVKLEFHYTYVDIFLRMDIQIKEPQPVLVTQNQSKLNQLQQRMPTR